MNYLNLNKWNKNKNKLKFIEENHTYIWNNKIVNNSVSSILEPISPYKELKKEKNINLEMAAVRGTMVHKWIEDDIKEVPIYNRKMLAVHQGYIDAYLNWKNIYKDKFIILESELKLYSPSYGYAGTIDAIIINKKTKKISILDFKTNSVPIDKLVEAQIAGYIYLIEEWDIAKIDIGYVLYLDWSGQFNFKYINIEFGKINFKKCLEKIKK